VPGVNPPSPLIDPSLDLPELDQGEDSSDVDVGAFELSMGDELDFVEDDAASDGYEVAIQEQADPGSNEEAADLDVGVDDLLDAPEEAPAPADIDAAEAAGAELDLQLDPPVDAEDQREVELGGDDLEALPELLRDDGDGDAGPDVERAFLPGAPEGNIPRGPRFEAEWLLLGTPCTALWAGAGEVAASAEHLMRFGRERLSYPLPSGARATSLVVLDANAALLATTRGMIELSAAGASALPLPAEVKRGGAAEVIELAGAPGQRNIWARLSSESLLRRRAGVWERHETGGAVRSLTGVQDAVTLLVLSHRPTLQLSSDGGSSFRELILPEPAATVALGASPTAVSLGALVALADAERGLCVSADGGETFRMVTGAVNVTAIALGAHAGVPCLFAALYREGKDQTELVLVSPLNADVCSIAELAGAPDADADETGRTSALVFASGCLWAAGGFGLAKLTG
jgi:hypothetical protein